MESRSEVKILRLFEPHDDPLSSMHYLAEYEAIIVMPIWDRLLLMGPTAGDVMRAEGEFNRKSDELGDFLAVGGLLVVLPVPFETKMFQSTATQNNQAWWARYAAPLEGSPQMVIPGSGTSVVPTGSGSEFDAYLEHVNFYQARLGRWFDDKDNVRLLAHNRAGGAIAAEITLGPGMIVCVPPPSDPHGTALLLKATGDYVGHRFGPGLKWPQPEEEGLREDREKLLSDFHTGMAENAAKQRAVQARKRAVFSISQVDRGVRYFDQATRPGSTPEQTMGALYNLIEMLKDHYGPTDWDGLADALGVSHNSVDRIKRLANKPELHLRHTNADDAEGIDQAELDRVVADSRAILAAFIARKYSDAAATAPPP
jgi:hypothetical protein